MKRIGVIANRKKPDADAVMRRIAAKADQLGLTLITCDATSEMLPRAEQSEPDVFASKIDVLLACGGDGTMLSAVRMLGDVQVPVMGVNLGSLGFMTSVTEPEAEHALEVLVSGKARASNRTLAVCRVTRNGGAPAEYRALNDIVVGWGESSRVVTLTVTIDETEVTSYVCDGLILSTPTGSTGHSLSAGGPILHPETPAFVLNVICPHTLSTRPLVVPDKANIAVTVAESRKELILSVDGQEAERVQQGDRIEVTRHEHPVQFLHLPGYDYFAVLRQKLGWRGRVT